MILYPTETLYALGVNALDEAEIAKLFQLKGREAGKSASWLVRDILDIELYAELGVVGAKIAARFLPGSLTLVLKAKDHVATNVAAPDRTIGFRISSDPLAQSLIADYMASNNAPLTCTSANVSGSPTLSTPEQILQQFGSKANKIDKIIDDGPRKSLASTVVKVLNDQVEIIREGELSEADINEAVSNV